MQQISDQEIRDNMDKAADSPIMAGVHYGHDYPDQACFILRDGTLVSGGIGFWFQKNTIAVLQLMLGRCASNDFQAMVVSAGLVLVLPAEYKYIIYDSPTERQEEILADLREIFGFDEGWTREDRRLTLTQHTATMEANSQQTKEALR